MVFKGKKSPQKLRDVLMIARVNWVGLVQYFLHFPCLLISLHYTYHLPDP